MTSLHCGMLPSSCLDDSSTHKLNFLRPNYKLCPSATRNVVLIDSRVSTQRRPQTHLFSPPGNPSDCDLGINGKTVIDECVSLLKQFGKNSKYMSDSRQIHAKFLKLGAFDVDNSIRNKLAMLYAKNRKSMGNARQLFDEMTERSIPVYAALLGSYCRDEKWEDLFFILGLMVHEGMLPDKYLVPTILKACSANQILRSGRMVHGYATRNGLETEIYVSNALIDLYANCGDLKSSRSVFDTMRERDVVSWTALFSAYMDGGLLDEAEEIFHSMKHNGVKPDLISWNALISGFTRNGEIDLAYQALKQMQENGLKPGVRSWNGIISGCVQNGYYRDTLDAFHRMLWFPEDPNVVTIVSVLPASAGMKDLNLGREIHGCALKHDLCWSRYVQASLIDMYSKCGSNHAAERIFIEAENRDTAMWNEMIGGYVNEGKMEDALQLLHLMQKDGCNPDIITYNTLLGGYARTGQKTQAFKLLSDMMKMDLKPNTVSFNVLLSGFQQSGLTYEALKLFKSIQSGSIGGYSIGMLNSLIQPNYIMTTGALAACAGSNLLPQGKEIHGHIIKNSFEPNIFVASALVDMYAKCHDMDSAGKVFWSFGNKNAVIWNAYIAGYIHNRQPEGAIKHFYQMLREGLELSSITLMTLLPACGDMAALRVGKELHGHIIKHKFDEYTSTIKSVLIDMYAKCGCVKGAKLLFDSEAEKDVALWNAMISAYTVNGKATNAIALFGEMQLLGLMPDHFTFTGLLSACVHDGLVEEGWQYFNSMSKSYGITAGLEHYICMVGIMGGAGLLKEALEFIKQMPYMPNSYVWLTLLQACVTHSNSEVGEKAAEALFQLEPTISSENIAVFNKYASSMLWDSRSSLKCSMMGHWWMTMKECSFANVGSEIHKFEGRGSCVSGEVTETWKNLAEKMKRAGFSPLDPVVEDEQGPTLVSCLHTEKLATCFGIVSSNACSPIRISKNAKMCVDCHTTMKLISKMNEREIFAKDARFSHHFKDGTCSCSDRW